ncbi:MAG TPA: hypothetical protein DCE18_03065 [Syntrophobacteraceae bacterium]|nr:hypothetical protein [Syntrophobacteraceae bacterium]
MFLEGLATENQPVTTTVCCPPETISTTIEQVARYAGGSGYKMDAGVSKTAALALDSAMNLIAPAVAYAVHPATGLSPEGDMLLQNGIQIAVPSAERDSQPEFLTATVCTLGSTLETACRELVAEGEYLGALLLDAAGVALLETLGQEAHNLLSELAGTKQLHCGCRFAPGHGTLPMSSQALLFRLVDGSAIGVSLNKRMVMNPNKSVSFFTTWGRKATSRASIHKCRVCSMFNCPFRIRTATIQL